MLLLLSQSLSRGNGREQTDASSWLEMLFVMVGKACAPVAGSVVGGRQIVSIRTSSDQKAETSGSN